MCTSGDGSLQREARAAGSARAEADEMACHVFTALGVVSSPPVVADGRRGQSG